MGWSDAKKVSDESKESSYLKLKDGDRKQVVVIGEPITFFQVFGEKGKEYSSKVPGSSFKFKVQVVDITTGEGKIWSGGSTILDRLSYLDEEMGPLSKKVLIVARKGSGKDDTTYNIDVKGEVTAEISKKISSAKLPSLERKEHDDVLPPSEDIPF